MESAVCKMHDTPQVWSPWCCCQRGEGGLQSNKQFSGWIICQSLGYMHLFWFTAWMNGWLLRTDRIQMRNTFFK